MKLISWNVNGLRACEGKGFSDIFRQMDADFFCLQETKMQAGQLDLHFDGYESYWNYADKKGYSGTAIFTKLTLCPFLILFHCESVKVTVSVSPCRVMRPLMGCPSPSVAV